jgi:hypothetical protein
MGMEGEWYAFNQWIGGTIYRKTNGFNEKIIENRWFPVDVPYISLPIH